MHPLIKVIQDSKSIILSTHTQPDGDGLGSQMALFQALKKMGKQVRVINVDDTPRKYDFLDTHRVIETVQKLKNPLAPTDLALVFDTNDPEMLLDLWKELNSKCSKVLYVDHHPVLDKHPLKSSEHFIDTEASSTGQMVFSLIKALQVPFDRQIALPLYTSIVFDTNYFRYIRGSSIPHLIAAELLRHDIEPEQIHRRLFGNHSPDKLKFLSRVLGSVEYELGGRLAFIRVKQSDMNTLGLEFDETRDVIDLVMNVESIEAAALFREDAPESFKLSFRSKGLFSVNSLAQSLGGGGHDFASGAYIQAPYQEIKAKVLLGFQQLFSELEKKARSG